MGSLPCSVLSTTALVHTDKMVYLSCGCVLYTSLETVENLEMACSIVEINVNRTGMHAFFFFFFYLTTLSVSLLG